MIASPAIMATVRPWPAIGLFFLAPLVGEFLLGNLPITFLGAMVLLAPMYGGGALLIREVARRFGLGWPGMLLLGLVFGILEEAFVTQSLFNPNYVGQRLLDYGYVPAWGIGSWWTVFVLSLHTLWSTAVPIALVETLSPSQRQTPWLGSVGLSVTAAIFLAGCAALAAIELKNGFLARPAQFAGAAVIATALVILAFVVGRRAKVAALTRSAPPPSPVAVGAAALSVGAAFFGLVRVQAFVTPAMNVSGMLLLWFALGAAVTVWSRRPGWNESHRLAVAAGFLLTYAWYGFVQMPSVGKVTPQVDLVGNGVFATGALILLIAAIRVVRREERAP